ncbi:SGNH/GDSL hydrolase family protein [Pseudomonas sp. EA_105y_Pfl2_R69]|uniref:SGNH/GDSL hydrolase family protein n=1 Tax=Pseudomonas sp. EA_105y_Pfl2_R69 TaxID=3088683 RepID=UPI0030D88260
MIETLSKMTLAPLILAQGLYTRWLTPRLPEPAGERAGISGTGPCLRLLILGDSAAAGVGVASQDDALAGKLATRLSGDFTVSWRLLAQSGLDTREVVQLLERSAAEHFDVVLVSVGVNDVTGSVSAKAWIASMARLVDLLQWKFEARQVVLSRIPPLHAFPSLPQPLRWYLGERAERFNQHLAELTRRRTGTVLLDTEYPLLGERMAQDGFHPGPSIYSMWADEVAALLRARPPSGKPCRGQQQ